MPSSQGYSLRPLQHAKRPSYPLHMLLAASFVMAFVMTMLASALAQEVQVEREVFDISRQLRCPVCISESVADSSATTSIEMRNVVREQVQAGRSEAEILSFFRERYGDWVLLEPPREGIHLVVWMLPSIAAVVALLLLLLYVQRWTKQAHSPIEASQEDLERVRLALARQEYDAEAR